MPMKLSPRHRMIMRLQLAGMRNKDIAQVMEMTETSISLIVNSDIYKAEFSKLAQTTDQAVINDSVNIRKRLSGMSEWGVTELENILKAEDTPKKLKADIIFDVLDREGYGATQKREVVHDYAEALKLAARLREGGGNNSPPPAAEASLEDVSQAALALEDHSEGNVE